LHRQLLSRVGGWLARPICDVSDATSGFFAFRRELAAIIAQRARGYKILLELLMAGQGRLRVIEVPICFRDRTHGASKLSFQHQWTYLQRLMTLLSARHPQSLAICALLDKQLAPEPRPELRFVGFQAPPAFLVGYGLDHAENFRHLPFIADLE